MNVQCGQWAIGDRAPPPPLGGGLGFHDRHRVARVDRGRSGAG